MQIISNQLRPVHRQVISRLIEESDEIIICVAFLKSSGLDFIIDKLKSKVGNCTFYFGTDGCGVSWRSYYPAGSVQGKVTTAALAKEMKFWAHMGHPFGQDFIGAPFFKLHPEYQWQSKFLNNMLSYPWTLFEAKK
mgnify:CR=1 FL=1